MLFQQFKNGAFKVQTGPKLLGNLLETQILGTNPDLPVQKLEMEANSLCVNKSSL